MIRIACVFLALALLPGCHSFWDLELPGDPGGLLPGGEFHELLLTRPPGVESELQKAPPGGRVPDPYEAAAARSTAEMSLDERCFVLVTRNPYRIGETLTVANEPICILVRGDPGGSSRVNVFVRDRQGHETQVPATSTGTSSETTSTMAFQWESDSHLNLLLNCGGRNVVVQLERVVE